MSAGAGIISHKPYLYPQDQSKNPNINIDVYNQPALCHCASNLDIPTINAMFNLSNPNRHKIKLDLFEVEFQDPPEIISDLTVGIEIDKIIKQHRLIRQEPKKLSAKSKTYLTYLPAEIDEKKLFVRHKIGFSLNDFIIKGVRLGNYL